MLLEWVGGGSRLMGAAITRGWERFWALWAGFCDNTSGTSGLVFLCAHRRRRAGVVVMISIADGWLYRGSWPAMEMSQRLVVQGSILITVALLVANHATGLGTQYDTGLYHAQVVEGAGCVAVVPGPANMHGRLAFNNTSLLFATLDAGPWAGASNHLPNGLLVWWHSHGWDWSPSSDGPGSCPHHTARRL